MSKNVFSSDHDEADILQKPNKKGRGWLGISLLLHLWDIFVLGLCLKTTNIPQTMSPLLGEARVAWNSSVLMKDGPKRAVGQTEKKKSCNYLTPTILWATDNA